MSEADDVEIVLCPDCDAEYPRESYCGECGYGAPAVEEPAPEPVFARPVAPRPFAIHEAAWCPYCVAWLGTWPSKEEARSYERALTDHPIEFCERRSAQISGNAEWTLRREAGRFGSLAAARPMGPRPRKGASA